MTRRHNLVTQWTSSTPWRVVRHPRVGDAYWLLFGAEFVAELVPQADGWRWETSGPFRSAMSRRVFPSWETAAAAVAGTAWARRVAGGVVRPGTWQRSMSLPPGRKPWMPRPRLVKQPAVAS